MGYFSNGAEGADYEAFWCAGCVHGTREDRACPVWVAHELHNYEECNKPNSILHELIPRSADGCANEQCLMYLPVAADEKDAA